MLEAEYKPRAQSDITSIVIYVGEVLKSSRAAQGLYAGIRAKIEELRSLPEMGSPLSDEMLERSYRMALVKNYRIIYSHDKKKVTIWRVVHTRQDIDDFSYVEWE